MKQRCIDVGVVEMAGREDLGGRGFDGLNGKDSEQDQSGTGHGANSARKLAFQPGFLMVLRRLSMMSGTATCALTLPTIGQCSASFLDPSQPCGATRFASERLEGPLRE